MEAPALKPCKRFPSKIQHATRDEALEHQKQLVFKNASSGDSERSRGLNVFPCDDCGFWHVGHAETLPLVWHYTSCAQLDKIMESDRLEPGNPRAFLSEDWMDDKDDIEDYLEGSLSIVAIPLTRSFQKRYSRGYPRWVEVPLRNSKGHVTVSRDMIERDRLLWFTRNEFWEHSIDDPDRETLETADKGFLRFGVPSSVAKLRWQDYLDRNKAIAALMGTHFGARADPTQWLATDEAVPLERVKRTEVYFGGAWVSILELDFKAFQTYIKGRKQVYADARKTMIEKLKRANEIRRVRFAGTDPDKDTGHRHDDLLRFFDEMAKDAEFNEAERITYEDVMLLKPQVERLPPPPPLPPEEEEEEEDEEI
jgi:hypothetical protein